MAELVRQHSGELLDIERGGQGQTDCQNQAAAEQRKESMLGTRRGVDVTIDVDANRRRGADRRADAAHEGKQQRLSGRVERPSLRPVTRPRKQRLQQEEDQDREDCQRPGVDQERHHAVNRPKDHVVVGRVPVHPVAGQAHDSQVNERKKHHHAGHDQDPEPIQERGSYQCNLTLESRQNLRRRLCRRGPGLPRGIGRTWWSGTGLPSQRA